MFLRAAASLVRGNRLVCHSRRLCFATDVRVQRQNENLDNQKFVHAVNQQHDENLLVVQWKDQTVSRFPYVYLRDLCTCNKCMNPDSMERLSDIAAKVPLDIKTSRVTVANNGKNIQIHWPDNHVSEFESMWLHSKKLSETKEKEELVSTNNITRKGVKVWDRSYMQDHIPRFDCSRILKEDRSLFEWLHALHTVGITSLENVPASEDGIACEMLSKRVGYVKPTHYGYLFDVFAKFDANNLAYTTEDLPLHCDIPQSEYYPGVQFLHCLEQAPTEGGANMFVDGFHIAQEFQISEPELFELLSVAAIPYWDIGKDEYGDFHLKCSRPVFELDYNGKITRFTYNNHVRDYYLEGDPEKVKQIYKGYMKMGAMMRDPKNRIDHKLSPGEMFAFNNSRVLHGRTSYTPTSTGNRHLNGCYLDWDLVYARLRALGKSLHQPFEE